MTVRAVLAALLILAGAGAARAQALVADLSDHLIGITAGFAGTDILLFGATEGEGEVIVVLRGPDRPVEVRRKDRVAGIWINTERLTFAGAPSFYRVAASRPLAEIASPQLLARHQVGVQNLRLLPERNVAADRLADFRAGLLRNKIAQGLYSADVGRVTFLGARLFRTRIYFPANVPPGAYTVEVLLVRNGEVTAAQTTPMFVSKTGIGAEIYEFAHRQSVLYGIMSVAIAVFGGWAAGAVFRKA